jgi:hypothetical protein
MWLKFGLGKPLVKNDFLLQTAKPSKRILMKRGPSIIFISNCYLPNDQYDAMVRVIKKDFQYMKAFIVLMPRLNQY